MKKIKKEIKIKNIKIGGNNPISIQSMTNIKTSNVYEVCKQIKNLVKSGCQIVRFSVMDNEDADAIPKIKENLKKEQIDVPLVADIHFNYKLAIKAIENGIDKIRINPGNIGGKENTLKVIEVLRKYQIPVRIGVNSGSIEKEFSSLPTEVALVESLKKYVKIFEDANYTNLVLSIKATDIFDTINANVLANDTFDYPLHIGLTESGPNKRGIIRSSYAIGRLLEQGIGDTIRVSLTTDPIKEIPICKEILAMFNLYEKPLLISCPTCGRTDYNMFEVINEIEPFLNQFNKKIKVAIMGCIVNGPGEASSADIGIAGGKNAAVLFKKGQIVKKLSSEEIIPTLKDEIYKLINEENDERNKN